MSVKAKVIKLWNFVKITWVSDEPTNTEIDTTTGGDKTVTVGVGLKMNALTTQEVTNGLELLEEHISDTGSNSTTLIDSELISSVDDFYNGWYIVSGGYSSLISDYTGSSKTAIIGTLNGFTSGKDYYIVNPYFYNKKFLQITPTLRSTESGVTPTLKAIFVKAYETLASWLSRPASHKIILIEIMVSERLTGWTAFNGYVLNEDGSYVLNEDGSKIILES